MQRYVKTREKANVFVFSECQVSSAKPKLLQNVVFCNVTIYFFFLSFKLLILFFGTARRKEPKEEPPSAHLPLKITHVFGRAARRSLRSLCGAALFSKNAPDFLYAPDVRTDLYHFAKFLEATTTRSFIRPHWSSVKRLQDFHVKSAAPIRAPKGVVLQRLVKIEVILAA